MFDPLKWPFIWMDAERAIVLITALHLLVLTIGMVALAERLRLRPPAGPRRRGRAHGLGDGRGQEPAVPADPRAVVPAWVFAGIDLVLDDEYPPSRSRRSACSRIPTALLLVAGHPQMTFIGLCAHR